jgi:hypothetical protein
MECKIVSIEDRSGTWSVQGRQYSAVAWLKGNDLSSRRNGSYVAGQFTKGMSCGKESGRT